MVICIAPLPGNAVIQRHSQRDRQVKRKVFKLRRDTGDIPCTIPLLSAGQVSFQSAVLTSSGIEKHGTIVQEDHSDHVNKYIGKKYRETEDNLLASI